MLHYVLVLLPHEYVLLNENSELHQSAILTTVRYEVPQLQTPRHNVKCLLSSSSLTTNPYIQHTVLFIYQLVFVVVVVVALRPNAGHGLLILEISRSHTTTHHSR